MSRWILHVDMNNFYASVECMFNPALKDVPMVVGGDEQARHGIVLSKNDIAKNQYGIRTGEVLWQARRRCPQLVVIHPDMEKYLKFSRMAMEIYGQYSDRVESFGLDEAWIDVTHFGAKDSVQAADALRAKIRRELGITASVGVSFNKIFAKLGSDMKKPDATTVLREDNYRSLVWPQPVSALLFVGPAARQRLIRLGIETIGDLACYDKALLHASMGKWGDILWSYANGLDSMSVAPKDAQEEIKSIGNSTTTPRDLICNEDVRLVLYRLSENVAHRLRENGLWGRTVAINVRDCMLYSFERQCRVDHATQLSGEIAQAAFSLFQRNYDWQRPVRSLGVRMTDLEEEQNVQLDFFGCEHKRERIAKLEKTSDEIRKRFGNEILCRASMMTAPEITAIAPRQEYIARFSGTGV
jgi:DNA polymerase-4